MSIRRAVVYLLWMIGCVWMTTPLQGQAIVACPWLTAGTAALVLGGEVAVQAQVSDAGEGSCGFTRISDATTTLQIEVSKTTMTDCVNNAIRLKGIGNEAWRCSAVDADGRVTEKIRSRVRDRYFTIAMRRRKDASASKDAALDDDLLEHAAESVAGNLF